MPVGRQSENYYWCANETWLKTDLTPSALFHQTNLTLPPLDPQSWILLIPIVSHVSECSTIRKASLYQGETTMGAETSTRVAKKGKACARRNLGIVLPYYSTIRRQTSGKQKPYRLGPRPSRGKQCMGRGRTTPCSNQPGRCATRIDLWRLGPALRRT